MPPQLQESSEMPPAVSEMPPAASEIPPQVQESSEMPPAASEIPPQVQESENAQSLEMSGQEQDQVQVQESIDMQPIVAEEKKEEDAIKTALVEQLRKIKEQTVDIENQLRTGGMMKKRKKTFYKRYKSKKSMKRRNKTVKNN